MQPESAQVFNGEDTIRWLATDIFGVPNSLVKSAGEMEQMKQQQLEMQQLQQGLATAQQGADVLETVNKMG